MGPACPPILYILRERKVNVDNQDRESHKTFSLKGKSCCQKRWFQVNCPVGTKPATQFCEQRFFFFKELWMKVWANSFSFPVLHWGIRFQIGCKRIIHHPKSITFNGFGYYHQINVMLSIPFNNQIDQSYVNGWCQFKWYSGSYPGANNQFWLKCR